MNGLSSSSVLDATSECTTDGLNSSNGHKKTAHAKISPLLDSELFERSLYIPLHNRINQRIQDGSPFFSLEFFPPKTVNGVSNFFSRVERMREGNPLFVDVTWHTGSDPGNLKKETSSTSIAAGCLNYCAVDTMLHMSCINYSKKQTLRHLEQSKIAGLRNILALRGDLQKQNDEQIIYRYRAIDMIRWIREEFDDYFTIACAGYPTGHPDAPSYAADILYLKSKIEAGANFVITQLFFEVEVFEKFIRDCREIGITVPIIPGILPIQSYESIRRIVEISKLTLPEYIISTLEPIRHNDDAVRKFGIHQAVHLCRELLNKGLTTSIHLYTLNRESASREILQELGLWIKKPMRTLPWKSFGCNHPVRYKETVRPIFWSTRPNSYVFRTQDWDDFPNGRWGNSSSPAFNDLADYYLFYLKGHLSKEDQLKMYGELKSIVDVQNIFVSFISQQPNQNGIKVTRLPWNEQEIGTQPETSLIKEQLIWCNKHGILTINSQPAVNGASSTDPLVGWGKPGGYCYQKAYLEFFTSQKNTESLRQLLPLYPRLSCQIINHNATIDWTNGESTMPIAVTWGVFPGSEIAQPTVVDPLSFRVWKDEAFETWNNWKMIYPEGSESRALLEVIHDEFCLITLVDNDFPKPTIIFDFVAESLGIKAP